MGANEAGGDFPQIEGRFALVRADELRVVICTVIGNSDAFEGQS